MEIGYLKASASDEFWEEKDCTSEVMGALKRMWGMTSL